MRLDKKGFMMAEVIVVSSVVLIILTTLYISYNKIFSLYETRLSYEDSSLLYDLAYYRDYLIQNNKLNAIENAMVNSNDYYALLTVDNMPLESAKNELDSYFQNFKYQETDVVYLFHILDGKLEVENFNEDDVAFREYLEYLAGNTLLNLSNNNAANYVMIIKRIYRNTKKTKFAYLVLE